MRVGAFAFSDDFVLDMEFVKSKIFLVHALMETTIEFDPLPSESCELLKSCGQVLFEETKQTGLGQLPDYFP